MPIYGYRCRSCGNHFERYQTFAEVALRLCPECRKKTLNRIISLVSVVFKGPGFYSTDNRPSSPTTSPTAAHRELKKRPHKEKTQPENANPPTDKTSQG